MSSAEIRKLKKQLAGAKRILSLLDSPFPDAIERKQRAEQVALVRSLERQILEFTP